MTQLKIRINEKELYSMEVPDEITSCDELLGIIERLKNVSLIFKKNLPSNSESVDVFKQKREHRFLADEYRIFFRNMNKNRNNAIKLLQFYYHDSFENKKKLSDKMGVIWKVIQARTWSIRNAHNITCDEVGLIRFPAPAETHLVETLRNPSFIYNRNMINELLILCEEVRI